MHLSIFFPSSASLQIIPIKMLYAFLVIINIELILEEHVLMVVQALIIDFTHVLLSAV
jgi:hypothetical protein